MPQITREHVADWMNKLKTAWEAQRPEEALALFEHTEEYFERPFKPGTSMEDYRGYWQDIVGLSDLSFDFDIIAVEGRTACVHWVNRFRSNDDNDDKNYHLDGMFVIEFDEAGNCRVFRQWWFMAD